jgi:hypothetical protein
MDENWPLAGAPILILPSIGCITSLLLAFISRNLKSWLPDSLAANRKRQATEQAGCTAGNCFVCIESKVPTMVSLELLYWAKSQM